MTVADQDSRVVDAALGATCDPRAVLVSPPRTGSTAVARMLWQHPAFRYHCHEPFEAMYWGDKGFESAADVLLNPMEVASGARVPLGGGAGRGGLLIKEMSFQLTAEQFAYLADLATLPVVFVIRDPRLSTTSRLRIVRELYDAPTFPPFESGWPSLRDQVTACRARGVPHLLVDCDDLRADPAGFALALQEACGLPVRPGLHSWAPRPELALCSPEVGALMSDARKADDPFYRRVLSSRGVQPVDRTDWDRESRLISDAGLTGHVESWSEIYFELRDDPALVAPRR
ncbi:hypothetical protein [Lentzea sp.]|uniref:hypothetical protein n=1 Tax=Lentzea sp. TaxID=56099 RepID=UPI002CD9B35E|nr:hypothetical protein [Lentzea sp.]HUQ56476.1 hypothetical protein [Lentzea sp.]